MARVTIGLPFYNAESLLRECLENIRGQTFTDFRAVIFDNCSSDATREISLEYARADSRFSYHRHDSNIGAWSNYAALLDACETEYFLWRAYDDYTDSNYLEELVRALDANPGADLAVGAISTIRFGRKRKFMNTRAPAVPAIGWLAPFGFVKDAPAAWIYGLWRAHVIRARWAEVATRYNHAWGGDFMLMFRTLLQGRVAGSRATTFYQRLTQHEWKSGETDLAKKLADVVRYRADAREYMDFIGEDFSNTWVRRFWFGHVSKWFINHRIYSAKKVHRLKARCRRADGARAGS